MRTTCLLWRQTDKHHHSFKRITTSASADCLGEAPLIIYVKIARKNTITSGALHVAAHDTHGNIIIITF